MPTRHRSEALHAEARLQQICCLGLKPQVVMPHILGAPHGVVGSHWNAFFWFDEQGNITNLYNESSDAMALAPLYLNEFHNSRELDVFRGWRYVLARCERTTDFDRFLRVPRDEFLRHAFYNEALRRMELFWGLQLVIRDGRRPFGMLGISRRQGEPPLRG